jgi:hypothetical protein
MPSTYTLNNGIELIATGEQSGTWGDTTNTNFELLDTSLDGQVTVTLASTGSSGSPNTLPVSDGAASNGRNRLVIFDDSSDLGGTAFVQLTPSDAEKIIYVRNSLSGSRSILLFQGTYNASNDYEVPAGTTAVVFFDGAGAGAVAANVFNNAHFDALNVDGDAVFKGANYDMTWDKSADTLQFRDNGLTINSSVDGQLDIDADTEVQITAPTVDIDASTAMTVDTTTLTVTGNTVLDGDLTVDTDTLYVDSSNNRVGIGASSPEQLLEVRGNDEVARFRGSDNEFLDIQANDGGRVDLDANNATGFSFSINTNPAVVIDGSKRFLIGTTTSRVVGGSAEAVTQIYSTSNGALLSLFRDQASNNGGAIIRAGKARNGAIVQDNDTIFSLEAVAHDGTDMGSFAGTIAFLVDGTPGANDTPSRIAFYTTADGSSSGTERMRITQEGVVVIGSNTSSHGANARLQVRDTEDTAISANDVWNAGTTSVLDIRNASNTQFSYSGINLFGGSSSNSFAGIYMVQTTANSEGALTFWTGGLGAGSPYAYEAMRIDSSRRLLIGATSNSAVGGHQAALQVVGSNSFNEATITIQGNQNNSNGAYLGFSSSRGTTAGSTTIVQDDDTLGQVYFVGADGTDLGTVAAAMTAQVDGTPGSNDMPGRLIFSTTADGSASLTERMRISSDGVIKMTTDELLLYQSGDSLVDLIMDSNRPSSNQTIGRTRFYWNGDEVARVEGLTGADTTNKDDGRLRFLTQKSGNTTLTEAMRIDENQVVLVNTTTAYDDIQSLLEGSNTPVMLQVGTSGSGESAAAFINNHNSAGGYGGNLTLGRVKSTRTVLSSDMQLGAIHFNGDDGYSIVQSAAIQGYVDGSPSGGDMPGRLSFRTALDGTDTLTEHMRISNSGQIYQYAGIVRAQNYAYVSMSSGTASATLVSNMSSIITGSFGMCKILMHGNENAATNSSARQYIVLKRTGGFEITEIGTGITYGNNNGNCTLSISGIALIATRAGTGGTGNCMVSFEVLYR